MRIRAGFFLGATITTFSKPAILLDDQIKLLQDRGLEIPDVPWARSTLRFMGFYRFCSYALHFQVCGNGADRHAFKLNTTFDTIADVYNFDRKLRLLILDAVERLEVALRSLLSSEIAVTHGPHWYLDRDMFSPEFDHGDFIAKIRNQLSYDRPSRKDPHVQHYCIKYSEPELPPCWMTFERLSIGHLSTAFGFLKPNHRSVIAASFAPDLHHNVLKSWFHAISITRNLAAHHSRLWNRVYTFKPTVAHRYRDDLTPNTTTYAQLVILQILLRKVAPENLWFNQLAQLFIEYPDVSQEAMGIPPDWAERDIWKT